MTTATTLPTNGIAHATRTCLLCGKPFRSWGAANRRCKRCDHKLAQLVPERRPVRVEGVVAPEWSEEREWECLGVGYEGGRRGGQV